MQEHEIDRIISFYLGECSAEVKDELEAWVRASEQHRTEFKRVFGVCQRLHLKYAKEIDGEMKVRVIRACRRRVRMREGFGVRRMAVAAAIVLLISTGALSFYYLLNWEREKRLVVQKERVWDVKPGSQVAMLVLGTGEEIELREDDHRELNIGEGMVLQQNLIRLAGSEVQPEANEKMEYNTIRVPRGGEYNLTLADGTTIWMNSDSELKFPVRFTGKMREVFLEGEAFFEVAPDSSHPFVVKTNDIRVEVLGTSFNIKAYRNEAEVEATLFTGTVRVASLEDTVRQVVLTVGEQACWHPQTGELSVSEVNLERVMAWRNGVFMFNREELKVVMHQIERWYGVRCVYDVACESDYVFNGYFSKDEVLGSILEAFTIAGGPEFEIDGDVVYVRDK